MADDFGSFVDGFLRENDDIFSRSRSRTHIVSDANLKNYEIVTSLSIDSLKVTITITEGNTISIPLEAFKQVIKNVVLGKTTPISIPKDNKRYFVIKARDNKTKEIKQILIEDCYLISIL